MNQMKDHHLNHRSKAVLLFVTILHNSSRDAVDFSCGFASSKMRPFLSSQIRLWEYFSQIWQIGAHMNHIFAYSQLTVPKISSWFKIIPSYCILINFTICIFGLAKHCNWKRFRFCMKSDLKIV